MSKKIFYLLTFLILQLGIFVQPALAVSCKDSQISWRPSIFSEGSSEYKLNFTITSTYLNGKNVYLVIDKQFYNAGDPTPAVRVQNNTFEIALPNGGPTTRGIHWATLRSAPAGTNNYTDVCSEISYQMGSVGACRIDPNLQSSNPPGSPLTIRFVGKATANYQLKVVRGLLREIKDTLGQVTTGSDGQGEFSSVSIPGDNGDEVDLQVIPYDTILGGVVEREGYCSKKIKIDINTQPQLSPSPGSVQPEAATGPKGRCPTRDEEFDEGIHLRCASGGGDPCDTKDNRGPAIKTAIGCIHTSPAEFVKDFMTFIIGISGGLAFLMMLLGAFQMLTSAGNPDTLHAGRERLTSAVIGLLIVIFATLLLQIIGFDILKIPGFGR